MKDSRMYLAGYHIGLPPKTQTNWMPKPAYTCAVPEFESISTLLNLIGL